MNLLDIKNKSTEYIELLCKKFVELSPYHKSIRKARADGARLGWQIAVNHSYTEGCGYYCCSGVGNEIDVLTDDDAYSEFLEKFGEEFDNARK